MHRTPEQQAELTAALVADYQRGLSLQQLERKHDVAASYAGRLIKRAGVALRPAGRDDPHLHAGAHQRQLPARYRDEYLDRLKQAHQ